VERPSGSIDGVGSDFQPFRINDLELVPHIFPRWNPLTSWMRQIEDFQRAAKAMVLRRGDGNPCTANRLN